jgi:outer membrane protein
MKLSAKIIIAFSSAFASFFAHLGPVSSQTLTDALVAAYLSNPELLGARVGLRSTDESVSQALSGWRPNIAMSADISRSETHLNTRDPKSRDMLQFPRNTSLTLTQPLFKGFRTSAGITKAELGVKSSRAALLAKEQDILLSAVTAFMSVVQDQAKLKLKINNEQVLQRQLEATQDRFRVGEITRTDVSQNESRLAGATSERIQFEGNLNNSRTNYLKIIGTSPGKVVAPTDLRVKIIELEAAISAALANHPDVVSQLHLEESARVNIKSVRGELLPSLSLIGTLSRAWEAAAHDDQKSTGSIKLSLSMPIFQKGSVYSRLRAAKQDAGKSRLKMEETRRNIRESAAKAWQSVETARARIISISAQIKAAEVALEGVQREAAVGSRTILDVLDSEQALLDAKINLVGANREQVVASFQLQESMGQLTAKNLKLPVKLYDPTAHYKEIRSKWIGLNSSGQITPGP